MVYTSMFVLLVSLPLFVSNWPMFFFTSVVLSLLSLGGTYGHFSYGCNQWGYVSSTNLMMVLMLSLMIMLMCLVVPTSNSKGMLSMLSLVSMLLFGFFTTSNFMVFYVCFEMTLVPTLILILMWGSQPERLRAGTYLVMYMVCSSLPFLVTLLFMLGEYGTLNFHMLSYLSDEFSSTMYFFLLLPMLVKLPVYGVHVWLPKAHVEAPLMGSMLLAGVLLKMGGYGLIIIHRLCGLVPSSSLLSFLVISLSLWGGILAAIQCLKQTDMKAMVAYSSIVHMSLVVVGVVAQSDLGYHSGIITLFSHSFVSSAMFCLAYYTYEKIGSRSFLLVRGMLMTHPILVACWFFYCMANTPIPPFLGFMGEMVLVPSCLSMGWVFALILGSVMFLSAAYNGLLYMRISHGQWSLSTVGSTQISSTNMLTLALHAIPLLLVLNMNLFN